MRKSATAPAYVLQSVDHALSLLNLFAEHHRLRIAEIGRYLDVAPSTASRLVSMLEVHGFVQRDDKTRGYVVGPRLRAIGFTAVQEHGIQAQVRPSLETLAAETGETSQFGILQGTTVVFLDCVEGRHHLRVASRIGALFPAHSVATGKVLLAGLPLDDLLALYPRERLAKITSRTLPSRSRLIAELDVVRRNSLASANGESEDDIYTVAVPVSDALGRSRGALSIGAPTSRITERGIALMKRVLRREAKDLSARLI